MLKTKVVTHLQKMGDKLSAMRLAHWCLTFLPAVVVVVP
jgi:hypothetical protein